MTGSCLKLAVVSFVYPAVKGYIKSFLDSIAAQTEKNFSLWIYDDGCELKKSDLRFHPAARIIEVSNLSPVEIRYKALQELIDDFDWVVFIDSDDLMHPSRVKSIMQGIEEHSDAGVVQHPLSVFDSRGTILTGFARANSRGKEPNTGVLDLHYNIYGMSNIAYRTRIFRNMPVLTEIIAFDWLLAAYASLSGEKFVHLDADLTLYRMHGTNVSRFIKPFRMVDIVSSLRAVTAHLNALSRMAGIFRSSSLSARIAARKEEIKLYECSVISSPPSSEVYLKHINDEQPVPGWWWHVANPRAINKAMEEVAKDE